ncbi:hypothetical protein [Oceanicoccus sp. KOV_DT_Chl]|uniref:hypothetical protein n=1 Tax=Oceanicoccus sp. KOV_DT_Chl TaxID=1904639 RepID=UPI000C7AE718|nr:hypothetical protein [Oceanicoccus sp. KOV_DT_Chl]
MDGLSGSDEKVFTEIKVSGWMLRDFWQALEKIVKSPFREVMNMRITMVYILAKADSFIFLNCN